MVRRVVDGRAGLGRDRGTKNRERLLAGDITVVLLLSVIGDPTVKRLLSGEHFSNRRHVDRRLGFDERFPSQGLQRQRSVRSRP